MSRKSNSFALSGKRIWVAGHRGLVGSAVVRRLQRENCQILTIDRSGCDLLSQAQVDSWMSQARPDAVILAAVRELFHGAWNGSAKLRLVGVALSSFHAASSATGQLELLDAGRREKLERLAQAADRLRDIANSSNKSALLLLNRHGVTQYLGVELNKNQG